MIFVSGSRNLRRCLTCLDTPLASPFGLLPASFSSPDYDSVPSIAADAVADAQIAATAQTAVADAQRAADAANAVLTAALLAAGSTTGSTSSTDGFANAMFCTTTATQRATAKTLEPALEGIPRDAEVSEEVVMVLRVRGITRRDIVVNLDSTDDGFRLACAEGFGVEPSKWFVHRAEQAALLVAWTSARIQQDAKRQVDAVQRAHGEPVVMLETDWLGLMDQFKAKFGERIHDQSVPSQSCYESFEEKILDGQLSAETLTHVVSLFEEDIQKASRPEPSRQLGLNLDATLTIQTRRRYVSTLCLTGSEELRDNYRVMANMWLLAQFQPGRALFADLTKDTWAELLEELLSTRNFRLERTVNGTKIVAPNWNNCLEYEYQIRKEAVRFIRTRGYPIQRVFWAAHNDEHHRMENWVTLLAIADASSSSADSRLEKRLSDMEKGRKARSRSPRGSKLLGSRLPKAKAQAVRNVAQPQLALPAPPLRDQKGVKGKGKGKAIKAKAKARARMPRVACSEISLHCRHWAKHPGIIITWTLGMPKAYVLHSRTADLAFKHHVPVRTCALVAVLPAVPYDSCGCLENTI